MLQVLRGWRNFHCSTSHFEAVTINDWYRDVKPKRWVTKSDISRDQADLLTTTISHLLPLTASTDCLPYGYHFIYANSHSLEPELNVDGYDSYQAPLITGKQPPFFRRRMWVQGDIQFKKPIRYNIPLVCEESITRVFQLNDSVFVNIKRDFIDPTAESEDRLRLTEARTLWYTDKLYMDAQRHSLISLPTGLPVKTHELQISPSTLLRYSGLTFNSHKIHYDKDYAKGEGFPNVLVHGPLTITLLLSWLQSSVVGPVGIHSIKYKNVKPLFAGEKCKLVCYNESDSREGYRVFLLNGEGDICVEGLVVLEMAQAGEV
ncbi:hypothetical protein BABINDRAFT_162939 [Babjeviella inositovora NRRL Y-12698]|uniref:MaoC-like domain-containing protein n=1 Tax=Babjeviella inositovora NRRL Y-12698 TaxID=984486 RepID=A0A1E3QKZ3_9ASCO|nr:uncharacterized protein BABINDRAFT_162939 [Babjeviella inositovora NRRL Y-12698]ODQ78288.1 hypothetical protein BABINDRAFT_162939 [Babjeviella inositovora NRRL Y-12698]